MAARRKRCAFCGAWAEGNFSIHRRPPCNGPEVPLCDACGGEDGPSCEEIWAVLALPGRSARERLAARAVALATGPALRPGQVAGVAASWGSYMSNGDPGACMYGFGQDGRPLDEDHRKRCLEYIDRCCLPLLESPHPGYTQRDAQELHALRRHIETAEVRRYLPEPRKECP
mgnify:FL=1